MKVKIDGNIYDVQWQEYEIGLYVCIYKNGKVIEQFGINNEDKDNFINNMNEKKVEEIYEKT